MASYSYKISLVGRSGVGKSSFAIKLVRDTFDRDHEATIGASFLTKTINLEPYDTPSSINFQIWDTAGQERYHSLVPMYTRNANIVLLFIDNPNTIDLMHDFKTYKLEDFPSTIFVVVTKIDTSLRSDYDDILMYCNDQQYPVYFISSKTGEGMEEIANAMKYDCLRQNPIEQNRPKSFLHNPPKETESKCCSH